MKYPVLIVLFLIALIVSGILAFAPESTVCAVGGGCEAVKNSSYNNVLGIENSYIGVIIFLFLIFLTYSHIKRPRRSKRFIIHIGTIIAGLIALYFIYLQQFVIKAFCTYCLIVDISTILALILVVFTWRSKL